MVSGCMVFGFNCQRQRFNRAHVQRSQIFQMPFLVFPSAQVHAVRAVDDVNGRQNQDGHFPASQPVHELNQAGDCGADQIIRKGPGITRIPFLDDGSVISQGNDRCNGDAVEQEKDNRRDQQRQGRLRVKNMVEQRYIRPIGSGNRQSKLGQIESEVNKAEPLLCMPEALNHGAHSGQHHSFRQRHVTDADQEENKNDGDRPFRSWQYRFQE